MLSAPASRSMSRTNRAAAAWRRSPRMRGRRAVRPATGAARTRVRASAASASAAGCCTGQTSSQRPQNVEALGRCPALSTPIEGRRQHRAHRPRIDPAIGVAADRAIDRAVVHAGRRSGCSAACRWNSLPSMVVRPLSSEHDVILVRPVRIVGAARAGRDGGVDRHLLAGRRARQHAQDLREIFQRRHQLFDRARSTICTLGSVWVRSPLPSLVTMTDAAGLGDQEIGAGDADIGRQETVAQRARASASSCRRARRRSRSASRCVCTRRKSASTTRLR